MPDAQADLKDDYPCVCPSQHLVVYLGLAAASQICIHVTRYYSIPEDGEYCF